MTPSRNTARTRFMLRLLALCVLGWLSWSPRAHAQVFAPMCDEVGASAIAPIPVVPHAGSEIRPGPCSPYALLEVSGAVPGEQDTPKVNVQGQLIWSIVASPSTHEVRAAAPSAELAATAESTAGSPHPNGVYRPPRCDRGLP